VLSGICHCIFISRRCQAENYYLENKLIIVSRNTTVVAWVIINFGVYVWIEDK